MLQLWSLKLRFGWRIVRVLRLQWRWNDLVRHSRHKRSLEESREHSRVHGIQHSALNRMKIKCLELIENVFDVERGIDFLHYTILRGYFRIVHKTHISFPLHVQCQCIGWYNIYLSFWKIQPLKRVLLFSNSTEFQIDIVKGC